jgi:hypothetical protein
VDIDDLLVGKVFLECSDVRVGNGLRRARKFLGIAQRRVILLAET